MGNRVLAGSVGAGDNVGGGTDAADIGTAVGIFGLLPSAIESAKMKEAPFSS